MATRSLSPKQIVERTQDHRQAGTWQTPTSEPWPCRDGVLSFSNQFVAMNGKVSISAKRKVELRQIEHS